MNPSSRVVTILSPFVLVAGAVYGCGDSPDDCVSRHNCAESDGGPSETGAADSPVDAPAGCDPSADPKDAPKCVVNEFGVFVNPTTGSDSGAGTKEAPVKTISAAVGKLAGKPRIYICEGTLDTAVELTGSVSIYGGFDCGWTPSNTKPKLAPPKGIALRITKVTSAVVIQDLEIVGMADPTTPGDSAIGAFASESTNVLFRRVDLKAGAGTGGTKGAARSNYAQPPSPGGNASGAAAGVGPTCTCSDGTNSKGGNGAAGNGADVSIGTATPAVGGANSGSSNVATCGDGTIGANGVANAGGAGSATSGVLTAAGWTSGGAVTNAPNGNPAQGGGGGGAKTGASNAGGGGGCGGCGGAGGASGGNGGSSFALLTFNSVVTLEGGSAMTAAAGAGGLGGNGQDGQGGAGLGIGACNGGPGGDGAGGGGGGAGGHSAPIGFLGTEPRVNGAILTPGAKGAAGGGGPPGTGPGNPGTIGNPGLEGKAQNTLAL